MDEEMEHVAAAVAAQVEDLEPAQAVAVLREVADNIAAGLDERIPYALTEQGRQWTTGSE